MKCIFRWLHFSDIHFQTQNTAFNTKQLREKLPKYLSSNIKDEINAIIFSGDFRYAPDKEENPQRCVEYIKKLVKSVSVTDENAIITVPGNHDLTRSTKRTILANATQKQYSSNKGTVDQGVLLDLLNDFSFYKALIKQLDAASPWDDAAPHCVIELKECNLLLLNSAITAFGKGDTGHLVLGSSYVSSAIGSIRNEKPIIAVGHHSLDDLSSEEKKEISNFFDQKGIRLYLCGHTHQQWFSSFGEKGRMVTVGCMMQEDSSVKSSFCVGELFEDGSVSISSHKWDISQKDWFLDPANKRDYSALYNSIHSEIVEEHQSVEKAVNSFTIKGYTLLGSLGCDGIKYYWEKNNHFVESIAFNKRLRNVVTEDDEITSAYTISTSLGCQLSATQQQCCFCETGAQKFYGNLSAEDIALQCIFMAEYDSNCPSYPLVRNNMREFAFMGQGEPGYNYPAIKQAIIMNDYVMERLGQRVSRYIISTCGVSGLIPALIQDIKSNVFKNKVTVHLSLHDVGEARSEIMPINESNNYADAIRYCEKLYAATRDKIGVGILMFDKYHSGKVKNRTLTPDRLKQILSHLDNEIFRIDLCSVNKTSVGNQRHQLSNETATRLLEIANECGFEVKLFSSFGDNQHSGCGMLSSCDDDIEEAGNKTILHFNTSVKLLEGAKEHFLQNL